jgi:acylphosphatase
MEKRAEIIVHGRVQKAGFRDLIDEAAFNLNLNGYVKNLKDGTVQVICEGEEDRVEELLEKINIQQYPIRVEKIDNLGDNLGTKIDQSKNEITGEIRSLRDDFRSYFDKRLSKVELEIAEIKARVVALQ